MDKHEEILLITILVSRIKWVTYCEWLLLNINKVHTGAMYRTYIQMHTKSTSVHQVRNNVSQELKKKIKKCWKMIKIVISSLIVS